MGSKEIKKKGTHISLLYEITRYLMHSQRYIKICIEEGAKDKLIDKAKQRGGQWKMMIRTSLNQ
jgi:hypothetical protein